MEQNPYKLMGGYNNPNTIRRLSNYPTTKPIQKGKKEKDTEKPKEDLLKIIDKIDSKVPRIRSTSMMRPRSRSLAA